MQFVAKQTYIYLALQAAVEEMGMDSRRSKLASVLSRVIQDKLAQFIDLTPKHPNKKYANTLYATMALDSEFPFGKGDHQKIQAVLYCMNPLIAGDSGPVKEGDVALMELFSSTKPSKERKKEGKAVPVRPKGEEERRQKSPNGKRGRLDSCKRPLEYKLKTKCTKKIKQD